MWSKTIPEGIRPVWSLPRGSSYSSFQSALARWLKMKLFTTVRGVRNVPKYVFKYSCFDITGVPYINILFAVIYILNFEFWKFLEKRLILFNNGIDIQAAVAQVSPSQLSSPDIKTSKSTFNFIVGLIFTIEWLSPWTIPLENFKWTSEKGLFDYFTR